MSDRVLRFERRAAERKAAELSIEFVRLQMSGTEDYYEWERAFMDAAMAVSIMDTLKKEKRKHGKGQIPLDKRTAESGKAGSAQQGTAGVTEIR